MPALVVLALIDVVMISNLLSIHLLRTFINASAYDEKTIIAQTGIHLTFLVSALAIQ